MLRCFLQFSDYLSDFFFGREFDGAGRASFFAACAEHHAIVKIFHDSFLSSFFRFEFVHSEFAVVYAFSAADAFLIVDCWTPMYLASRNAMICFFSQLFHRFLLTVIAYRVDNNI